eukprot:360342-Chlamydomonas_euryale.AAC.5
MSVVCWFVRSAPCSTVFIRTYTYQNPKPSTLNLKIKSTDLNNSASVWPDGLCAAHCGSVDLNSYYTIRGFRRPSKTMRMRYTGHATVACPRCDPTTTSHIRWHPVAAQPTFPAKKPQASNPPTRGKPAVKHANRPTLPTLG